MPKLTAKIRKAAFDRRGESLIETLVAILISVLSLSLLAMMIASSTRITSHSEKTMGEYYQADADMVTHAESSKLGSSGTLELTEAGVTRYLSADHEAIGVTYYGNSASGSVPVVSYTVE